MTDEQKNEARRLKRLLREMYKLAEHASLSGALADGAVELTGRYNAILQRLPTLGIPTDDLFPPLPADASVDRIGIVCKLLSGYLADEDEDDQGRRYGPNVVIGNMSGMEDLEKLKDIGRVIRENIADAFSGRKPAETPPAPPNEAPTQERTQSASGTIPMPEMQRQNY